MYRSVHVAVKILVAVALDLCVTGDIGIVISQASLSFCEIMGYFQVG